MKTFILSVICTSILIAQAEVIVPFADAAARPRPVCAQYVGPKIEQRAEREKESLVSYQEKSKICRKKSAPGSPLTRCKFDGDKYIMRRQTQGKSGQKEYVDKKGKRYERRRDKERKVTRKCLPRELHIHKRFNVCNNFHFNNGKPGNATEAEMFRKYDQFEKDLENDWGEDSKFFAPFAKYDNDEGAEFDFPSMTNWNSFEENDLFGGSCKSRKNSPASQNNNKGKNHKQSFEEMYEQVLCNFGKDDDDSDDTIEPQVNYRKQTPTKTGRLTCKGKPIPVNKINKQEDDESDRILEERLEKRFIPRGMCGDLERKYELPPPSSDQNQLKSSGKILRKSSCIPTKKAVNWEDDADVDRRVKLVETTFEQRFGDKDAGEEDSEDQPEQQDPPCSIRPRSKRCIERNQGLRSGAVVPRTIRPAPEHYYILEERGRSNDGKISSRFIRPRSRLNHICTEDYAVRPEMLISPCIAEPRPQIGRVDADGRRLRESTISTCNSGPHRRPYCLPTMAQELSPERKSLLLFSRPKLESSRIYPESLNPCARGGRYETPSDRLLPTSSTLQNRALNKFCTEHMTAPNKGILPCPVQPVQKANYISESERIRQPNWRMQARFVRSQPRDIINEEGRAISNGKCKPILCTRRLVAPCRAEEEDKASLPHFDIKKNECEKTRVNNKFLLEEGAEASKKPQEDDDAEYKFPVYPTKSPPDKSQ
ncbi:unnamed protein product [Calicophoron daubneyi]|uniref:Uncharacterized protein n=1 Tax=Calicophoron daubneyi TaxID=300641 RepID=A0AAV2TBX9_CALDB